MAKVNLPDVGGLSNPAAFREAVNKNFDRVAAALDNAVSRNGAIPNHLTRPLDANDNYLINVRDAVRDADALNMRSGRRVAQEVVQDILNGGDGGGSPNSVAAPISQWWTGDGTTTDFPFPDADVLDPLAYDTAIESGVASNNFYVVDPQRVTPLIDAVDPANSYIRVLPAPAAGVRLISILRGRSTPYIPPTITTVAPEVVPITEDTELDRTYHNTLLVVNEVTDVTLTIRQNTGDFVQDWQKGEFFLVLQQGPGNVTIEGAAGVTVTPPNLFNNSTRGQGSMIAATCSDAVTDDWATSGDLFRVGSTASKQTFRLFDRSVLFGAAVTTGSKDALTFPYDVQLLPLAESGVLGALSTAQASGSVLTLDIKVNGVSIFATLPSFDNTEKTTATASVAPAYSTAFLSAQRIIPAGAEVLLEVGAVGDGTAQGLSVHLTGVRAS